MSEEAGLGGAWWSSPSPPSLELKGTVSLRSGRQQQAWQEGLLKKAARSLVPGDSVESPLLCPVAFLPKLLKETLNPCLTQTTQGVSVVHS